MLRYSTIVIRDTRQAYADLLLAKERLRVAGEAVKLRNRIADLAEARLNAGDASVQEASTAKIDAMVTAQDAVRIGYEVPLAEERLRNLLGEGDGKHRTLLVVNRHGEGGRRAVRVEEMQDALDLRPASVIPFQPTLFTATVTNSGVAAARRGKFADAVAALALQLTGRPSERRRWWSIRR